VLRPNTGPPASRTINVYGGHLPRFEQIELVWAAGGGTSLIATTAQTDGQGSLAAHFVVPAVPPGYYRVEARVKNASIVQTQYHVALQGVVEASVTAAPAGEIVRVTGKHFASRARLLLAVYPMVGGAGPMTLAVVHTSSLGRISFEKPIRRLAPGEYELRVWSMDYVTVDLADTYFQVVV
jgi:hypothetical protein